MELKTLFARAPLATTAPRKRLAEPEPVAPDLPDRLSARPLLEIAAIFGALFAIDHGFGSGGAFVGIEPHPFWLPVLLMAVTYGSGMGLVSALTATIIWVTDHGPLGQGDHLQLMLALSIMPMLWMTSALVIGEISSIRLIRLAKLSQTRAKLKRDQHKLVDMVHRLTRTNRALQVRIAVEERALEDAVDAAVDLGDAAYEQRIAGIGKLVRLVTGSDAFVFYHVVDGNLLPVVGGLTHHPLMIDDLFAHQSGRGEDKAVRLGPDCQAVPIFADGASVPCGVLVVKADANNSAGPSPQAALCKVAHSLARLVPPPQLQEAPLLVWAHPRALTKGHAA